MTAPLPIPVDWNGAGRCQTIVPFLTPILYNACSVFWSATRKALYCISSSSHLKSICWFSTMSIMYLIEPYALYTVLSIACSSCSIVKVQWTNIGALCSLTTSVGYAYSIAYTFCNVKSPFCNRYTTKWWQSNVEIVTISC